MPSTPCSKACFEFQHEIIRLGFLQSHEQNATWELLRKHAVYQWLNAQPSFTHGISTLQGLPEYMERKNTGKSDTWQLSQFVGLVANAIGIYLVAKKHPERITILHGSERKKALKAIAVLVQKLGQGNRLLIPGETAKLLELLLIWRDEIEQGLPTGLPQRRDCDLPMRLLIAHLARVLIIEYTPVPASLMLDVVSIVDSTVSERTVQRVIRDLKSESKVRGSALADRNRSKS